MGKLQQILNDVNGPSFAIEIQKKLPQYIQENINFFYPVTIDYDEVIKKNHNDDRKLITTGSFVPIPYPLAILPIFTGGKESDSNEVIKKTLELSGGKNGSFCVDSLGVSSDLCFYVFSFIMQMSIFRKTSLVYIDLPYLCEFLGWKNCNANKNKISLILEKLASVKFSGNYSGVFKKDRKKESLINIFHGELIKKYYIDIESDVLIVNVSDSISNLFAMDKVWYGLDLFKYSKIPTGHAKTLALHIGGKARGLKSIDISYKELLDRLSINNLKSDKQKNKIIKDSLTILMENKIIQSFQIKGASNRKSVLVFLHKKDNYFCFSKNINEKANNSLKCHEQHIKRGENLNLKSIYLKILKINEINMKASDLKLNKIQKVKNELASKNFKFSQIKISNKKLVNNNKILNEENLNEIKHTFSLFLDEQASNYNKNEKLLSDILNGQIDAITILAESLNDEITSSIVNDELKHNLQKKLFDFMDNNSINVGVAVKRSKIPYIKLSNGNIKLKRFNSENYNELKGLEKVSMHKLLLEKNEYSDIIYNQGLISEYDYKKLRESNKPLIQNKKKIDSSILVEGANSFWFESDDSSLNPIEIASYTNFKYNRDDIKVNKNEYEFMSNKDFKNIVEDINQNEIILKGKIPVYDGDEKIVLLTVYDFKNYIKTNKVSLIEKNVNNENLLVLSKNLNETKKVVMRYNHDFCNYDDIDYRKEYHNLRDGYLNNMNNKKLLYTLNDSNKLKIINQARENHLKNIPQFGFIQIDDKEPNIDFDDLLDTDDFFNSIEFENIPDRI